jgi:hypothetical protein
MFARWHWILYTIPCLVVLSVYLFAFWPGLVSYDARMQYAEANNIEFTNRNPFFHTLNIYLIKQVWESPAAMAILQILGLSLVVGWGGKIFRQWGVSRTAVSIACLMVAASPFNAYLSVTIWKDIFYGIAFLALVLMIVQIIFSDGKVLKGLMTPIALGVIASLVMLYRHNGPPAALGALVILMPFYRRYWRNLTLSIAIALVIWIAIIGPLASILGVERVKGRLVTNRLLPKISAHLNAGTEITDEEKQLMMKIPYFIEVSKSPLYACSSFLPVKKFIKTKTGILPKNYPVAKESKKFLSLFFSLTLRNPMVTINNYACATSWMWKIFGKYKHLQYWGPIALPPISRSRHHQYNESSSSKYSVKFRLSHFLFILKEKLYGNDLLRCLFLNTTPYFYLLIFSLVICALRTKNWKVVLIILPVILHSATIFLVVSHTAFRYQWPVFLASIFLFVPLLCVPRKT